MIWNTDIILLELLDNPLQQCKLKLKLININYDYSEFYDDLHVLIDEGFITKKYNKLFLSEKGLKIAQLLKKEAGL